MSLGSRRLSRAFGFAAFALCVPAMALAADTSPVTVAKAWVRGTVPAQTASGAFMELTSKDGAKLISATSPVAGSVELHEMRMDGNVMTMREVKVLDLPAGKVVKLEPNGYHLMLLDLKKPLTKGVAAPLTLTVESRDGKRSKVNVLAEVRELGSR